MSDIKVVTRESNYKRIILWLLGIAFLFGASFIALFGYVFFKDLHLASPFTRLFTWLFALNNTQTTWYITRAAGWISYFLLWFSMVWGLAIPTRFFERFLSPTFAVDFHEYISLLSLGFIALHVGALLFDHYLPFTLAQIFVPFLSTYRPVWVGLGVIGFYLMALVTITFYLRKKIGQKRFKAIHTLSLFSYLGVIFHAFFAGSDSSLPAVQLIYLSSFLVIVFMTAYWLIRGKQAKKVKNERSLITNSPRAVKR